MERSIARPSPKTSETVPFDMHSKRAAVSWVIGWAFLPFSPVATTVLFGETVRQIYLATKQLK